MKLSVKLDLREDLWATRAAFSYFCSATMQLFRHFNEISQMLLLAE